MTTRIYLLLLLMMMGYGCIAQAQPPTQALLKQIANSAADTTRIDLLVKLGTYYLLKPGEAKTDLDSSMDYLQQALVLSRTLHAKKRELEILKWIGDNYLEGRDIANGKMYFKQVTDYYHQLGDQRQELDAWTRLSDCIKFEKGVFDAEKMRILEYIRPLSLQIRDSLRYYDVLYDIAKIHLIEGYPAQAEHELLQVIAGYKALHWHYVDYAYDLAADASRQQHNHAKTIFYRLQAVQAMEAAGDTIAPTAFYQKLCKAYVEAGQGEKGLAYVKKEKAQLIRYKLSARQREGNALEEARGWVEVGDRLINDFPAAIDEKLFCYENARRLFHQLRDTLNEAATLKTMGDNYLKRQNPELAERTLLLAIDQYKSVHYPKLHPVYFLLANAYRLEGNTYKELFYYIEVIRNMQRLGDTSAIYMAYMAIGLTYQTWGIPETSLYYYQKAWQSIQLCPRYDFYYRPALQVVSRLIALNRTGEALEFIQKATRRNPPISFVEKSNVYMAFGHCYRSLKDDTKAEYYYQQLIRMTDTLRMQGLDLYENYITNYRVVIDFYLGTNQYAKAAMYMNKLPSLEGQRIGPTSMSQLYYFRYKIDSARGDYRSAMRHLALHKSLDDSIFNATKSQQINDLNVRYETSKKEDSIQLQAKNIELLKNQEQLQADKVQKSIIARNILIGGSCMLLLLLGVLYNRYRLKKRSNLQLEAQKQEISAKNTRLESLLRDNEWLLREVHHRVKNNLQLVMSLLNSQAAYLQDEAALHAVAESQHRVQSMSLIHQKLYKNNNVSSIYMPEYIRDLVDYLKSSFKTGPSLYFDLQIEPIGLDVVHAVPVGLILNEAITNSLKYAFAKGDEHTIHIRLYREGEDRITMVVADNGQGLPDGFDFRESNSFGMILMQGLTEDLGGCFSIASQPGTSISMTFKNARVYKEASPQSM